MQFQEILKKHKKKLYISGLIAVLIPILAVLLSYLLIAPSEKYVYAVDKAPHTGVGLVLGAGITKNGKPFKELQARLDSAANAYNKGVVDKLLLSGDNRFYSYDEPTAMKNYLVQTRHLPASALTLDYAGRSTYESCERASKVFEVNKLIIFSAGSHLPRAIYLCRHFGIEAHGIASGVEANNHFRRELLARVKAVYNANLRGEPTILGDPLPLR